MFLNKVNFSSISEFENLSIKNEFCYPDSHCFSGINYATNKSNKYMSNLNRFLNITLFWVVRTSGRSIKVIKLANSRFKATRQSLNLLRDAECQKSQFYYPMFETQPTLPQAPLGLGKERYVNVDKNVAMNVVNVAI